MMALALDSQALPGYTAEVEDLQWKVQPPKPKRTGFCTHMDGIRGWTGMGGGWLSSYVRKSNVGAYYLIYPNGIKTDTYV